MRYLLLLSVFFAGCLFDTEQVDAVRDGTYDMVAYREDGSVETKGWIRVDGSDDGSVKGSWQLAGLDGDGSLVGRWNGDTLTVDLHPNWADHNFLMHGVHAGGRLTGTWEFVGFAGPMKGGTFVATKEGSN